MIAIQLLGSSYFIMIISGWEYVKKDTMIPHDLESYPLHLKTVSKIQDGDSITVVIDIRNDILLTLYFTPLDVDIYFYFFNLNLCASRNGDGHVNTTIDGDFITNSTENIWSIRKTNISLDLDFNSITLFRYNFSKIEEGCINLRSINVLWVYFTSYLSSGVDELQYKPHNRGNKTLTSENLIPDQKILKMYRPQNKHINYKY